MLNLLKSFTHHNDNVELQTSALFIDIPKLSQTHNNRNNRETTRIDNRNDRETTRIDNTNT